MRHPPYYAGQVGSTPDSDDPLHGQAAEIDWTLSRVPASLGVNLLWVEFLDAVKALWFTIKIHLREHLPVKSLRRVAIMALVLFVIAPAGTSAFGSDDSQWREELLNAPVPASEQDLEPPATSLAEPGARVLVPERNDPLLEGLAVTGASTRTVVRGTGASYTYSLLEMSADGLDGAVQLKTSDSDTDFQAAQALPAGCGGQAQYCSGTDAGGDVRETFVGLRSHGSPVIVGHTISSNGYSWTVVGFEPDASMLGESYELTVTGGVAGRLGGPVPSPANLRIAQRFLSLADGLHSIDFPQDSGG